jgi:DNA-directed RNA polymerase specialized sigma24 family protein
MRRFARGNKPARRAVVPDEQRGDLLVSEQSKNTRFRELALPHLNAAYNLARWLTRNDQDAQDVVQEAYLRAFKFFDSLRGTDARAWLLAIVRNSKPRRRTDHVVRRNLAQRCRWRQR